MEPQSTRICKYIELEVLNVITTSPAQSKTKTSLGVRSSRWGVTPMVNLEIRNGNRLGSDRVF